MIDFDKIKVYLVNEDIEETLIMPIKNKLNELEDSGYSFIEIDMRYDEIGKLLRFKEGVRIKDVCEDLGIEFWDFSRSGLIKSMIEKYNLPVLREEESVIKIGKWANWKLN